MKQLFVPICLAIALMILFTSQAWSNNYEGSSRGQGYVVSLQYFKVSNDFNNCAWKLKLTIDEATVIRDIPRVVTCSYVKKLESKKPRIVKKKTRLMKSYNINF